MQTGEITMQNILLELKSSGCFSSELALKSIQGGAVNSSFKLIDGQSVYFVKVFSPDLALDINRKIKFEQQQSLAKLALAPKPVYLSQHQRFQIDHWVEEKSLFELSHSQLSLTQSRQHLSSSNVYHYLAQRMAFIHQIEVIPELKLESLDLPSKLYEYMDLGEKYLSTNAEAAVKDITDVWYQAVNETSCLCHNDLSLQHVVLPPSRMVFDWEYAACSSPYFDIAASLIVNKTEVSDEEVFINSYASALNMSAAEVKQKVQDMKSLAILTNQLWFAAAKACEA